MGGVGESQFKIQNVKKKYWEKYIPVEKKNPQICKSMGVELLIWKAAASHWLYECLCEWVNVRLCQAPYGVDKELYKSTLFPILRLNFGFLLSSHPCENKWNRNWMDGWTDFSCKRALRTGKKMQYVVILLFRFKPSIVGLR